MEHVVSPHEQEVLLAFLNEVAPDTYDEGEQGPHTFKAVSRDGAKWVVAFEHDEGDEEVEFSFEGPCLVDDQTNISWIEAFNAAYGADDADGADGADGDM